MFTHILRRRVSAVLAAAVAAAAVLALTAPAGASTGARQTSPEMAGYTADHAQFKEVDTYVYLNNPTWYAGMVTRYGYSVQIWSADRVATANFTASTSGEFYTPSFTIYDRSTHKVIVSNPNARHRVPDVDYYEPGLGGPYRWADEVGLHISYRPDTGQLLMYANVTPYGNEILCDYKLPGQSFTKARIGMNFGSSPWDTAYTYTPPAKPVQAADFIAVSLTSYSGHIDGLWSWWVHHKLLARPPGRGLVAIPRDVSNFGHIFRVWFVPTSAQGSS